MRGEKTPNRSSYSRPVGSPPHMRGKVGEKVLAFLRVGITPAYAGKSWPPIAIRTGCKDHPRIRGEKLTTYTAVLQIDEGHSVAYCGQLRKHRLFHTVLPGHFPAPAMVSSPIPKAFSLPIPQISAFRNFSASVTVSNPSKVTPSILTDCF